MEKREIKFRGQMTTGEWVYGLPHLDREGSTAYWNECSYRICWNTESGGQSNAPIKNGTLCQYTGLKDKNGKEIYEGDIDGFGWVVCFESGVFCIKQSLTSRTFIPIHEANIAEIIGNIYKPPTGN